MSATFHLPGEGENFALGGSWVSLKAAGGDTGGSLTVAEHKFEPGFDGAPIHVHREMHDMFYVLEGTLTVRIEDRTTVAPAGSFICVQPQTRHTISNPSDQVVRILHLCAPAGVEQYMRDLVSAWQRGGGSLSADQYFSLASDYDFEFAEPPSDD